MRNVSGAAKLKGVTQALKDLAIQAGAGNKIPTLRELVTALGVSQTTIVRAIERLEADGLLVRRHGSGIFVASETQATKLLILCEASFMIDPSAFWGTLLEEVITRIQDLGIPFEIRFTSPNISFATDSLLTEQLGVGLRQQIERREYAAALLIAVRDEVVDLIDRSGIKCASFAAPGHMIVNVTHSEVIRLGLMALRDAGCRTVAVLSVDYPSDLDQAATFTRANGMAFTEGSQIRRPRRSNGRYQFRPDVVEDGFETATRIFSRDRSEWPDGIVSAREGFTLGMLHGMAKLGVRPGTDVAIATHANSGTSTLMGFEDQVILVTYEIPRLADALVHAAESLVAGVPPEGHGWELGMEMSSTDRDSFVLFVQPSLSSSSIALDRVVA